MKPLHIIQLQILKKLLFSPSLRYSDLKPNPDMENNQLDFHLDSLINQNFVTKTGKNYVLTDLGKEYAGRMDTGETEIAKQSKVCAWVCCTRIKNGNKQFLIGTRLKQPFYGCQGFLGGKVRFGESIIEAAQRELYEEANLEGNPQIVSLKHFRVFGKETNKLVEDKLMFLCWVENPKGNLTEKNEEGEYHWINKSDLPKYLTNPFEPLEEFLSFVDEMDNFQGQLSIKEVVHHTEKF